MWAGEKLIQARGMKVLRRRGQFKKTVEPKAAATGAKLALVAGLFKLGVFIFLLNYCVFNFAAKKTIKFYLYKKKMSLFEGW
ncbi:hypothetical protein MTO98_13085 [Mucilaginibacter sp. SMC90]|uniref:hypothetical protein n=1 Tax=Mucilaginibacter sp. SMC90 TaxID=2929803 RepID=UPI001FB53E40|nr:hypothetical protein [Mucilaginibacter sp. SMC90]UOE52015.1 hypothetical protein MTO98_13085 [Mucilaginibacter sp. SMC90]